MYNLYHPAGLTRQYESGHDSYKDLCDVAARFNKDMERTGSKLRASVDVGYGWYTVSFILQDGESWAWVRQRKYSAREAAEALARFDHEALTTVIGLMQRGWLYALADGTHADPSKGTI